MESKYTCIIVDDEPLARQLIITHLSQIHQIEIIGEASSALEADNLVKSKNIDLIFLDIEMPLLTGIEWLRTLSNAPKIILTTAFSEFALEGYELNVIDYLLKPITFERFFKAVSKTIEMLKIEDTVSDSSLAFREHDCIVIKSSHQLIRISLREICYIEGMHKYVKIITKTKKYTTLFALSAIAKELDSTRFYRCHRSFIINLEMINLIDGNIACIDHHRIPISKTFKSTLITKLGKRIG